MSGRAPVDVIQLDAAVARLRAKDHGIKDEDTARLSPLMDRRMDFLGRFLLDIKAGGPGREPAPLRGPHAPEQDGEDDGILD
ncbi:hypothetical protein ACWC6I_10575 [Streptomyces sp. NPDC001414]